MSLRHGAVAWQGNGFTVDRLQTSGISSFGFPKDTIQEMGDPLTVGIVRDIPDLTFDVESLDMTAQLEALITGQNPGTLASRQLLDPALAIPMDIVAPIRQSLSSTTTIRGVVIPYLTLDTISYKFAIKANSSKTATMRGDSAYYTVGVPQYQRFTLAGVGPYSFSSSAAPYVDEQTGTQYALGVCLKNPTTGASKRVFVGANFDYTDSATGITFNSAPDNTTYTFVDVVYSTVAGTTGTLPLQNSLAGSPPTGKPAAVRSKNVDVYIAPPAATPVFQRLTGVQTVDISRKVTLEADEEFGNPHYVSQDYNIATVSGTLGFKPTDANDLYNKLLTVTGVTTGQVIGPFSAVPVQMEIRVSDPATGARLETVYCPDVVIDLPGLQSRVSQKFVASLAFGSNTGVLQPWNGTR